MNANEIFIRREFLTWSLVCSAWMLWQWGSGVLSASYGDWKGISSWRRHLSIALCVTVPLALESSDLPLVPECICNMNGMGGNSTIRNSSRGANSLWHKPCTTEKQCLEMTGWQQVTKTQSIFWHLPICVLQLLYMPSK